MPGTFTLATLPQPEPKPRRVLVTGAAGRIGTYFARNAPERFELRLMVRPGEDAAGIADRGEVVEADLDDLAALKPVFEGIDTVLHLAGNPDPSAPWSDLLPTNIVGTYHAFVAAKAAGCRRVVYASSIHAVSGYPVDVQVHEDDPVNPGDVYGVSKAFGEALGRYMAEQEGLQTIAVRIAAFQAPEVAEGEKGPRLLDALVSDRDLLDLFTRAIDDEAVRFAIVHGVSENRFKRLSIEQGRALFGYSPQDDVAAMNPALAAVGLPTMTHSGVADGQASGIREDVAPA